MAEFETVAWVRPPEPIRGLDHLGVQAPCIALYAQLLPGITNVTDRARYYSFYPWVLRSFESRYMDHSLDEFRRVIRRAECLFALIAIRHARVVADEDEGRHGARMVGRQELLRIPADAEKLVLDEYAALDGPKRYFKNKLGGLGQYYFGPLRDLRILDHSPHGNGYPPGYDRQRGRALAEALAKSVPEDGFFKALETPVLAWSDLDDLAPFCPCALRSNVAEHQQLLDLFLARSETFRASGGATRRASLGLMLDLAGRGMRDPKYGFEDMLRGAAYSGALIDGSPWRVAPSFLRAQRSWAAYQRNELLSLATQGLFAAVLRAIERDRRGKLQSALEAADVATELLSSLTPKLNRPLTDWIVEVRNELPPISKWSRPEHELQRGWHLRGLRLGDHQLQDIATTSVRLLAALLARGVDEYPYADFELDPEYFDPREVHLLSLRRMVHCEWARMSGAEWIRWLSIHWGISRHLRVALRKLNGERRDTFRIRPLEGELHVVEAPEPAFTTPRVGNSVQILRDLDLIELDDEQATVVTPRGQAELEDCRAS
jgi:hypothetical protein